MSKATLASVAPGTDIDQYRVMRLLGRGGMGAVYLARDMTLGRLVALKFLARRFAKNPVLVEQFHNEARLTAQLAHPNIVTLYGVGEVGRRPYVALEYVEGQGLDVRMREGRLDLREVVRVLLAVARAMAAAHEAGVLHRDLKPGNILLANNGRIRVVDFGIAMLLGDERAPSGKVGDSQFPPAEGQRALGTPKYIAPEQWAGNDSKASDIWAIGIIAYELLAGRHPYPGLDAVGLMRQAMLGTPVPIPPELREIPTELSALLQRCLSVATDGRPSAAELAELLSSISLGPVLVAEGENQDPFRGLSPFTERDSSAFYGRDDEAEAFLDRLRREPLLVLAGPTGAGKTSFVLAGVIPRLHARESWTVLRVRPGPRPLSALAGRLVAQESETRSAWRTPSPANDDTTVRQPVDAVPDNPDLPSADINEAPELRDVMAGQLLQSPQLLSVMLNDLATRTASRVLLVVDQLEEVITLTEQAAEQRSFMDAVCAVGVDAQEPIRVVMTVRDDFLGRIPWGGNAHRCLAGVFVLDVPEALALRETIVRPLRDRGYVFDDPSVVDEMLAAVQGEVACLPLLQFSLSLMWKHRDREGKKLLRADYDAGGKVGGALAAHADRVLQAMSPPQVQLARVLLLRLVTPLGTRRPVLREPLLEGLDGGAGAVLDLLVDARLIAVRRGGDPGEEARLELAHDSLATMWARLARWIAEGQGDIGAIVELQQAAELWQRRGRRSDEVWSGQPLRDAQRLMSHATASMPAEVVAFVRDGLAREQRARRWRKAILGTLVAALAVAAIASGVAARSMAAGERQQAAARARSDEARALILQETALAAQARGDPFEARARLRSALELGDSAAMRGLWRALARDPQQWMYSTSSILYDVAFSSNGRWLAASGQDHLVHLVDRRTFQVRPLRGHRDQVGTLAFAPDGERLVSGGYDGELRVWDLRGGVGRTIAELNEQITSVVISSDSSFVATSIISGIINIWDLTSGKNKGVLAKDLGQTLSMAFSPVDDRLAVGGAAHKTRVFHTKTGQISVSLDHASAVDAVAFSPDGTRVATSFFDGAITIWDAASGAIVQNLGGHVDRVRSVGFLGANRLVSCGFDRRIRIWDLEHGIAQTTLEGRWGRFTHLAIDQSKKSLATVGDRSLVMWNLDTAVSTVLEVPPHSQAVYSAKFSPDGATVVSGAEAGRLVVFDARNGTRLQSWDGAMPTVMKVLFDRSGTHLAMQANDGRVHVQEWPSGRAILDLPGLGEARGGLAFDLERDTAVSTAPNGDLRIWRVSSASLLRTLSGHMSRVWDAAVGPDRRTLASVGMDGTLRLWSLDSGQGRVVLRTDGALRCLSFSPDGTWLAVGAENGDILEVDTRSGAMRPIVHVEGRPLSVAIHPDGQRIAVASSDGLGSVFDRKGQKLATLRGHRSEVNSIAFDSTGDHLVTSSDDTSTRVWDTADGRPTWFSLGIVGGPPRAFGHRGWTLLSDGAVTSPPSAWWSLVEGARLFAHDESGLCLWTHDDRVQRWREGASEPAFTESIAGVESLVATKDGCAVLTAGEVRLLRLDKETKTLALKATALSESAGDLLVAIEGAVVAFDSSGKETTRWEGISGVTALHRTPGSLLIGFAQGTLELRQLDGKSINTRTFASTPSSRVVFLSNGPAGTLVAGFENGVVGLWDLASGRLLDVAHLHGPIVDAVSDGEKVFAVSQLGDRAVFDLRSLELPYCELLRNVWQQVQSVWVDGAALSREPPREHRCAGP